MKDTITLKEFVKHCGSQEQAAITIGVRKNTVYYWVKGTFKPNLQAQKKLKNLNIERWW